MNLSALAAHLRMTAQMIEDLLAFGIGPESILGGSETTTQAVLSKFRKNGKKIELTAEDLKKAKMVESGWYPVKETAKKKRVYKKKHWTQRPENRKKLLKMVMANAKKRVKANEASAS